MTTTLFDYPKGAAFGRVLPKNKIYEHATPSTKLKERFVQQVEQITWQQKLAPETINLPATRAVPEIQIFRITLKTGELDTSVLQCIDHAIPFPLYFELQYGDRIKATAAFKRPSDGDQSKWVVSSYFDGPWLPATTPRVPLPLVLDLEQLYARLLTALSPFPPFPGEPMTAFVVRMDEIRRRTGVGTSGSTPAQRKTVQPQGSDQRRGACVETGAGHVDRQVTVAVHNTTCCTNLLRTVTVTFVHELISIEERPRWNS
ncbi:MAG: DUF4391 domain-containing protein [Caldilineaceae bacterium]